MSQQTRIGGVIAAILVGALFALGSGAHASLISYWNFDDASGTAAAANTVAGGPVATLRNMNPSTAWVAGRFGGALNFTAASNNYLDVLLNSVANIPQTNVTVSMWIKTTSGGAFFSINDPEQGGANDRNIWVEGTNVRGRVWDFSGEETITATPPSGSYADGTWHNVVHQYGAGIGGERLYVDGQLRASGTRSVSGFNWRTHAEIGWSNLGGYFNGQIDDVAIWNSVLDAATIQRLASGAIAPTDATATPHARLVLGGGSNILGAAYAQNGSGPVVGPVHWELQRMVNTPGCQVDWFFGNQNWSGTPTYSYFSTDAYAGMAGSYPISNKGNRGGSGGNGYPDQLVALIGGTPPTDLGNYSVRWSGQILIDGTSAHAVNFGTNSDDASDVYIDGTQLFTWGGNNDWDSAPFSPAGGLVTLSPGWHTFQYDQNEGGGGDDGRLRWDPLGGTAWADIPADHLRVSTPGEMLAMGDYNVGGPTSDGILYNIGSRPGEDLNVRLTVSYGGDSAVVFGEFIGTPEPATSLLLAGGLLALARRRRRQSAKPALLEHQG